MITTKKCINVYSDMNPWIDFTIVPGFLEDFEKAEEIVLTAYDEWFELDTDETIADYISRILSENKISHEIYFKDEDEN